MPRRCRCSARRRRNPRSASSPTRDWTDAERLQHEKAAIGYYLSGHPFAGYAAELAPLVRTTIANLAPRQDRVLVAGIVTQMRVQASRRGKMAFVTLDDGHGSVEIMVYNETFDSVRALLREDQLVIAEVKVTQRMTEDGEAQGLRVIAENIYDLATIRQQAREGAEARVQRQRVGGHARGDPAAVPPGRQADHRRAIATTASAAKSMLSEDWRVNLDDALIERLREWLAPENVQVVY